MNDDHFLPSAETLLLREYLRSIEPDTGKEWGEIQAETGIKMDIKGKAYLRSAARAEKLEYTVVRNTGIILAGPRTGSNIVEGRIHKAKRAIVHTKKSYQNIAGRFLQDMSEQDRHNVLYIGSVFAAMEAASQTLQLNRKQEPRPINVIPPSLPPINQLLNNTTA